MNPQLIDGRGLRHFGNRATIHWAEPVRLAAWWRRFPWCALSLLAALLGSAIAVQASDVFATTIVPPPPAELVALLRGGGNVIYFRHASTEREAPQPRADFNDCSWQRNLNGEGRAESRAIGEAFARLKVPVG
ncbi:MAG: hypothetical protein ABIR94_01450 [Rubrivivax sp.]